MTLNGLVLASLGASSGGGGLHLPGPCGTAPEPPPPVVKWEGQCLRGWLCNRKLRKKFARIRKKFASIRNHL